VRDYEGDENGREDWTPPNARGRDQTAAYEEFSRAKPGEGDVHFLEGFLLRIATNAEGDRTNWWRLRLGRHAHHTRIWASTFPFHAPLRPASCVL
jgi:hypothetical protein